jgi:hypothetical protein
MLEVAVKAMLLYQNNNKKGFKKSGYSALLIE